MKAFLPFLLVRSMLAVSAIAMARPLDKVKKDALTVGIRSGNAPFGYIETAERKGLEYELAAAIAEGMGCRFRLEPLSNQRDGEEMLLSDKVDLLLGTVKAQPELKEKFLLSNPYFRTGLGIMVMQSNQSVFTLSDLNDRSVAATPETNADKLIESFLPMAKLEITPSATEALALLKKGDVEAVVHDRSALLTESVRNPSFRLLDVSLTEDRYVILVNKKSSSLLDAVNKEIDRLRTAPSVELASPLAILCARYHLNSTVQPVALSRSPTASNPAGYLPQTQSPLASPRAQSHPPKTTPKGVADLADLERRMDDFERQLQDIQRDLAQLNATLQKAQLFPK